MKIDDVVDLIDGLLKDLSTIDKKTRKKTYKRKLGKVDFNFTIEDKKEERTKNYSYKYSDDPYDLGFWLEYKDLLDKLSYKREDIKLIGQVNRRFNQVWSNKLSRDLVVEAYLTILKKALDEKSQDTEKIRKYISPYTISKSIL